MRLCWLSSLVCVTSPPRPGQVHVPPCSPGRELPRAVGGLKRWSPSSLWGLPLGVRSWQVGWQAGRGWGGRSCQTPCPLQGSKHLLLSACSLSGTLPAVRNHASTCTCPHTCPPSPPSLTYSAKKTQRGSRLCPLGLRTCGEFPEPPSLATRAQADALGLPKPKIRAELAQTTLCVLLALPRPCREWPLVLTLRERLIFPDWWLKKL